MNRKTIILLSILVILFSSFLYKEKFIQNINDIDKKQLITKEQSKVLYVYSSRKEELVQSLFEEFTRTTGIKIEFINDDINKILMRMEMEQSNPKADILLTADVANLHLAEDRGLLEKLDDNINREVVPLEFKDDYWLALTKRTRILVYAKDRVQPSELSTYSDLASPKWKGLILVRSSNSPYNQSFVSAMIAHIGQEKTRKWIRGFVDNFSRKPQGGDIDQIKAIAAGEGDVALVNSYYIARMMASNDDDDINTIKNIGVFFPDQSTNGAMLNISGIAMIKNAVHKNNAIQLINFMLGDVAQKIYAKNNNEYPINDKIRSSAVLDSWGDYKIDNLDINKIGEHLDVAIKIMDEEGWK